MATENDIVLIHLEDEPIVFARIEHISPDAKNDWYQVKLLLLQVPLQVTNWILRDVYIDGQEFTMGGKRVRMEKVVCPKFPESHGQKREEPAGQRRQKVISLKDLKKI
jgi:hypothetical protein